MAILKPGTKEKPHLVFQDCYFILTLFLLDWSCLFLSNPVPERALHQGRHKWASHEVN